MPRNLTAMRRAMIKFPSVLKNVVLLTGITLVITSCADVPVEPAPQPMGGTAREQAQRDRFGSVLGDGGVTLFSLGNRRSEESGGGIGGGIGVNVFIWQATLDTIDFIPLASADPFGGLIITDWFQSVDAPGERVKMHVQIRDAALRADAVRVSVFRQVRNDEGDWLDAAVEPATARSIEDHILTRARELRISSTAAS
jgi:hypothetical protein